MFSTCPFVRPSVTKLVSTILKIENELTDYDTIMTQVVYGARKRNDKLVTRSTDKVTRGQRWIWRPGGGIVLDRFGLSSFSCLQQI